MHVHGLCGAELFYCDVTDAEFCPNCDTWVSAACADPNCTYGANRPDRPSGCQHDADRHWNLAD